MLSHFRISWLEGARLFSSLGALRDEDTGGRTMLMGLVWRRFSIIFLGVGGTARMPVNVVLASGWIHDGSCPPGEIVGIRNSRKLDIRSVENYRSSTSSIRIRAAFYHNFVAPPFLEYGL